MSITDNPEKSRYELSVDGQVAVADYTAQGSQRIITHVGVPEALRGRGLATQLMQGVVADAKARGLKIVPLCPFAKDYLERNPV